LLSLVGFTLHGAIFINLKTTGELHDRSERWTSRLWIGAIVVALAVTISAYTFGGVIKGFGLNGGLLVLGLLLLGALRFLLANDRQGWAFITSAAVVMLFSATIFVTLFPNVMISSTSPANNLTIYNAASGPYTLGLMSRIALFMVPVVLIYQGYTYWIFRKRVSTKPEELHY